jgi:hypothetical protein
MFYAKKLQILRVKLLVSGILFEKFPAILSSSNHCSMVATAPFLQSKWLSFQLLSSALARYILSSGNFS